MFSVFVVFVLSPCNRNYIEHQSNHLKTYLIGIIYFFIYPKLDT